MSHEHSQEVTVLLADDHAATRDFLTTLLEVSGMQVVGQAADGREAVQLCEQLNPEIVVLDVSMPRLNGFEAALQITELSLATKIIFLTGHTGKEFVSEALRVGGMAFVSKEHAAKDLLEAIDAVLQGKTYVGESAA